MAHGKTADTEKAIQIAAAALAASVGLDPARSALYYDLVYASLGEAARGALRAMDISKYEFQSEFAKNFMAALEQLQAERAQTEAERAKAAVARTEGQLSMLTKLLAVKFGRISQEAEARLAAAATEDLERWAERILTADTIEDVLR